MGMKISFNGAMTRESFIRANCVHLYNQWIFCLAVAGFLAILSSFTLMREAPLAVKILMMAALGAFLMGVAFFTKLSWGGLYKRTPHLSLPRSGWLSEERVHSETEFETLDLPWEQFTKTRSADGILLLYTSPEMFYILARDEFETDEAWKQAESFVIERMAKTKKG
jgi:hypothetical protein